MHKGQPASAGIGIGPAVLLEWHAPEVTRRTVEDPQAELRRFDEAVERFCARTEQAAARLAERMGEEEAGIVTAQIHLIRDPELQKEVRARIGAGQNAEYALFEVCGGYIALFEALDDELMRARAADFADIRAQVIGLLTGRAGPDLAALPAGCVLVAEDIAPSQAAGIDRANIAAIVTESGTRYSHIAILARALRIPAVVSLGGARVRFHAGETLIVDGSTGEVIDRPAPEQLSAYREKLAQAREREQALRAYRDRETRTADGRRVELAANLAAMLELPDILAVNADGVGLFRTEFLYMNTAQAPGEEAQLEVYRALLAGLRGKPAIVRTLDVGGDKEIPYLGMVREENPFLGYRGVRYCLGNPAVFLTQLRALLRASVFGALRIMVPMVCSPGEMHRVRELLEQAKSELRAQNIPFREDVPLGAMIETPAAAMSVDLLAPHCDFFSLGTNDLVQYTLAVDRGNERVAELYQLMHPAVLRLIHRAVGDAAAAGVPVGVCGEMAADPRALPFLIGCGVDELSVATSSLLAARRQVCHLDAAAWSARIPDLLALSSAKECETYVARFLD